MAWMIRFPILSIAWYDLMRSDCVLRQAPPIDTIPFRAASRHIERTDTACLTKPMLGCAGIESILREILFAFEGLET